MYIIQVLLHAMEKILKKYRASTQKTPDEQVRQGQFI